MFWLDGERVTQESLTPLQPSFAPEQQGFGPNTPKHLLHPLLTTLGNFEVSGLCSRHLWSQLIRERAEYCFESTVSEERTH